MKALPKHILLALFLGAPAFAVPEKMPAPTVFVDKVRSAEIFDLLTYPARLIPRVNATILSETDGVVRNIKAPLGRTVKKGDGLMTVTHTDPVYHYAPVTVRAPVSGVVSSVDITEGSVVGKGQKLATITDPSKVRISVELAVSDLGAVRPGLTGDLRTSADPAPVSVKVVGVSPFVDPATGTATAELELESKGKDAPTLPPGLVGNVTFKVREHKGVQIPEFAVVYRGQEPFLRTIVEGKKAKYIPVELGQTRRGMVEVLSGIKDGEQIIIRSSGFVANGDDVTVEKPEAPKS